eukprot:scaffold109846_cov36-Prasinocladus_malaysianus.AAC.4
MTRRPSQRPRPCGRKWRGVRALLGTAASVVCYALWLFAASGMPNATLVVGLTPAEDHHVCLARGLRALSKESQVKLTFVAGVALYICLPVQVCPYSYEYFWEHIYDFAHHLGMPSIKLLSLLGLSRDKVMQKRFSTALRLLGQYIETNALVCMMVVDEVGFVLLGLACLSVWTRLPEQPLTAHFMFVPSCLPFLLNFCRIHRWSRLHPYMRPQTVILRMYECGVVTQAARITPQYGLLITLALGLAERSVLLDWAAAEGGHLLDVWPHNTSMCDWRYISCSDSGNVQEILTAYGGTTCGIACMAFVTDT